MTEEHPRFNEGTRSKLRATPFYPEERVEGNIDLGPTPHESQLVVILWVRVDKLVTVR